MAATQPKPGYIATLDGWRAIAVLLVIGAHSTHLLTHSGTSVGRALAAFFDHAGYGVDLFFAVSGYLIVTLLLREKDATGRLDLNGFYLRRAFRILPPALTYLAVLSLLGATGVLPIKVSDITSALFFYRNYVDGSWYTGHFWSLAIEEHFYLVVPLVVGLLSKKRAFKVFAVAALLCIAVRALEASYLAGEKVEFRTESRFDALMWGSLVAIASIHPRGREWLMRHLTGPTLLIGVALAIPLLFAVHSMPVRRTIVAIMIPTVIIFTVLKPQTALGRMLEATWLRWIGRLSYSLYLWQMLFFVPEVHLPALQGFPGALLGTLACALASYRWVEKPSIAAGREWFRSSRAAPSATRGAG